MVSRLILGIALLFVSCLLSAQSFSLKGKVVDADTDVPLSDASLVISGAGKMAVSGQDGRFEIKELKPGKYTLIISHTGYLPLERAVELNRGKNEPLAIRLTREQAEGANKVPVTDIPTITLDEAEALGDGAGEVANLLNASRDVFQAISGFGWSVFRFRERGYDSGQFQLFMNGVPFNDPETNWTPFGDFAGLNDVLRNRETTIGLDPADFTFSEVGGANFIDTRASVQRKQIRATYAVSNRVYRNRMMLTASTGLLPGGWAVSVSGSRRWAEEGYVEGTSFDGYSYFLSVDKKIGRRHGLNLTFFGAPVRRGRSADSFQEMYAVAGSNYYNPLWGYQNGEKRNSQIQTNHQPVAILRYDFNISARTTLLAAAYTQFGKSGFTRLNWQDAPNAAPDFNRRLPSSLPDAALEAEWFDYLSQNESARQVDWDAFYEANQTKFTTVPDVNGIPGNTVSGLRASYIVEDQRSENLEAGGNLVLNHQLNDRIRLQGGGNYQWYRGRNFKIAEDLLGADYWNDWDFFGQFDTENNNARFSDIRVPNRLTRAGDIFGFDYDENVRRGTIWTQAQIDLPRFQFFAAVEGGRTAMWRTGAMQNGRFPDSSLGDSEQMNFNTWGVKGGGVWKINGRNYLYANGFTGARAPQFRDVFLSPRVRNATLPGAQTYDIRSVEGGYLLRAPRLKMRLTGYLTTFENEALTVFSNPGPIGRVYEGIPIDGLNLEVEGLQDLPFFIGATVMQGINRRHTGLEMGVEVRPVPSWVFSAAANVGQYIYTNRPNLYMSPEYNNAPVLNAGAVFQNNFYVPRTPQTTGALSVKYEARRFWFASLSFNYADNFYYEFDRVRRTNAYVEGLNPENPIWNTVIDQQKAPAAYTLDFFGGKSWRVARKYFVYLNVGVNNLLNDQNIVISGREVYRNVYRNEIDNPRYYTNELLYAFGTNYFISLGLRL